MCGRLLSALFRRLARRGNVDRRDDSRRFIRILQPSDPWTPEGQRDEKIARFRGQGPISVYRLSDNLDAYDILAVFYGFRSGLAPLRIAYYPFRESEPLSVGGKIEWLKSKPDWPAEYSAAHHEVVEEVDAVARHMVDLFDREPAERRRDANREILHRRMFRLAAIGDVPARFKKFCEYKSERMQREEPDLWKRLAAADPIAVELADTARERKEKQNQQQGKRKKRRKTES